MQQGLARNLMVTSVEGFCEKSKLGPQGYDDQVRSTCQLYIEVGGFKSNEVANKYVSRLNTNHCLL